LVLAAATACRGEARAPASWTDDDGVRGALPAPARAVVSLSPAFTEILFAIGAGDRLVGRTRWCDYPPAATEVPSVGDGLPPVVEVVLARRPDLVLFYSSAANAAALDQVRRTGVTAVSLRVDRLDDVPRIARTLGRLTGVEDRAATLAEAFERQLDSARAAAPRAGPRVALVVWDNPPIVIGAGSFLSEIARLAGAANVFDDIAAPSAPTSIETIAARDPDALLVVGEETTPAFARRPEWQVVPAVRQRRLVPVRGSEFHRPSPRVLQAVAALKVALAGAPP
jgi:ABC-type Fe3+-hydroxamate transport system substrate-binding protein